MAKTTMTPEKPRSMFAGAGKAQIPGVRNYFGAGDYVAELVSVEARDGFRGQFCIATFRIRKTLVEYPAEGAYVASNRPGEVVACVYDLTPGPNRDFHLGRLRQLAETILGDVDDLEDALEGLCAPPGTAAAGTLVRVTGHRAMAKKGTPVVNLHFQLTSDGEGDAAADEVVE